LSWQEVEASIAPDHSAGRAFDVAIHSIKDTISIKENCKFPGRQRRSSSNPSARSKSVGKKKVRVVGAAYDLADGRIRLLNK
jgi:hypothetical protein